MRMNLNQQAKGEFYDTLHNIMQVQSPIVDCGVHYVDIMYQMAQCRPVRVHAIGCRNWDLVPEHICNYGQLQVEFEDGSVGWYEAGWGPMMSETAYFIKDVAGPEGAASIVPDKGRSDDKDHTWRQTPSSGITPSNWIRNSSGRTRSSGWMSQTMTGSLC